jgi:enoyl-CoA hydratase/carnithine racemase
MLPFYRAWLAPRYLTIPVIAAVNGPAVGAGLCLALACDLRYAATSATFSAPFLQLGTHGGMAASWQLPEAIGVSRARELLYTGRVVQADEALYWGHRLRTARPISPGDRDLPPHVAQRLRDGRLSGPGRRQHRREPGRAS